MALSSSPRGRPKILVVEDDAELLRMLEKMLDAVGDVITATNGKDAADLLSADPVPDLVLTDVMMPKMDGVTLAKQMKADKRLSRVPIIMLTAKETPLDVVSGINAGARAYLTKPFKHQDLLAKVKKILGL